MAVSCFVMGQKLTQFAGSDVEVEVDVQVFYVTWKVIFPIIKLHRLFLLSTLNIVFNILHRSIMLYVCN